MSRSGPGRRGRGGADGGTGPRTAPVSVVARDVADADAVAKVVAEYEPGSVFTPPGAARRSGHRAHAGPAPVGAAGPRSPEPGHLHRLTEHLDPSAFVLFSPVAGVFGNPGQANYAPRLTPALEFSRSTAGRAGWRRHRWRGACGGCPRG
ncbi:KR domain-containing protein [Streptomyces tricolor]|nr:KR domain-containing protein [Streptomyces tricolor]